MTEDYIRLCLRLGRHAEGLVDSYYGPRELDDEVSVEPLRDPADLARDAANLLERTDDGWLRAQLVGLETAARKLAGSDVPYSDEFERCYGVRPEHVPESVFERAHAELDRALPGSGSLAERYQAWQDGDPVPPERAAEVLEAITTDLRSRTRDLVGLPEGEEAELEFVRDEAWWAYNRYLGGLRSTTSFNLDLPMAPSQLVGLLAHELYPGHHTELAWKEQLLVREQGKLEASIVMVDTPQSLIAEGIACLAAELVVEDEDKLTAELLSQFGIDYDAVTGASVRRFHWLPHRVQANAAMLMYEDGVPEADARAYLKRWALVSDQWADHMMRFMTEGLWRAYVSTYAEGYRVCSAWVGGDPARFRRLLTERLTPADLLA